DTDYNSGPVAKTPGHPWWSTSELHNHVYELGELADYVELEVSPWKTGPQLEDLPHSRHCILFEQLRYFAYSIVNQERERGTLATFTRRLEAYAHNHNKFARNGFTQD
ncbi:replication initiation protein, partial [Pseudomonas viridiflava]|uniref:replication initiation protein n=1 Tax=Pseudomonas viridiflava TaxID=33069 RepID=UPI0019D2004B